MKSSENASAQHFTFFRRDFFQKVRVVVLPFLVLPRLSAVPPIKGRPLPEFNIGDLIAQDWLTEFDENMTDFGEVIGLCYLPSGKGVIGNCKGLLGNTWTYYIYWTHSTCDSDISYPCFDGEPSAARELRLVRHA